MNLIENLKSLFKETQPPYSYDFIMNLKQKDYPKYLKKIFKYNTGYNLNLKNPKSINEKIQWLKLYDSTPLKTQLTDKILVRDWVESKIGKEYLKPLLGVYTRFEDIDFSILPNSFMIKTNHGCKWHYMIKNKDEFINKKELFDYIKLEFTKWLNTNFFAIGGLELQYKNINPKILIEPILLDNPKAYPIENEIYCFNGVPKVFQEIKYTDPPICCVYDETFNILPLRFTRKYIREFKPANETIKQAVELSKCLCREFKFVRIDWLIYRNKLYFNEMTFTPFSGFNEFPREEAKYFLGDMLKLK